LPSGFRRAEQCRSTQRDISRSFAAYDQQPPAAKSVPESYQRKLMHLLRDGLSTKDEPRIDSAGNTVGDLAY
jgi:hypothetical protein